MDLVNININILIFNYTITVHKNLRLQYSTEIVREVFYAE